MIVNGCADERCAGHATCTRAAEQAGYSYILNESYGRPHRRLNGG